MQYLDYEKLDVYRRSMELVSMIDELVALLPSGRGYLIDQLRRSSSSVVLNIAEGSGEHSHAEKCRFYRMAKRSATECASTVHICQHLKLIQLDQYAIVRNKIIVIVAMLSKLIYPKTKMPLPLPLPCSNPEGA